MTDLCRHTLFVLLLIVVARIGCCADLPGFLQRGDRWVFMGDSITDDGVYRRTVERVCLFYHPDAGLSFVNAGVSGTLSTATKEQFAKASATDRPTIVSLMTGMNNTINSDWRLGKPIESNIENYRQSILETVRKMKANGLTVVLMAPTYTDESLGWASSWELAGTRALLEAYGKCLETMAKEEGVLYLPVGQEFEAYQNSLPPVQILRFDGVHPNTFAQYQVARTILHHLNLIGPLESARQTTPASIADCPVEVALAARRLSPTATSIPLTLNAAQPGKYTLNWSYKLYDISTPKEATQYQFNGLYKTSGNTYAKQTMSLTLTGNEKIALPLPAALPVRGGAADLLLEVTQGDAHRLYLFNLTTVPVLHPVNGVVSGVVNTDFNRPEGQQVADWTLTISGKALLFDAEVQTASLLNSDFYFPWGRDGVLLSLDLRPSDRFANLCIDSDVYETVLNVRNTPIFGTTISDFIGRSMSPAATVSSEKTPTGYKLHFALVGKLSKFNVFDASNHDLIGFAPVFVMQEPDGQTRFYQAFYSELPHDHYANNMAIIDLKNQLTGDAVVNVALTRL